MLNRGEDALRLLQMWNIVHLAVDADCASVGLIRESLDHAPRMCDVLIGRRVAAVDCFDLIRVNGTPADETIASGAAAASRQTFMVAKIGVERVDWQNVRGGGGEQAQRTRQLIRGSPFAVSFF